MKSSCDIGGLDFCPTFYFNHTLEIKTSKMQYNINHYLDQNVDMIEITPLIQKTDQSNFNPMKSGYCNDIYHVEIFIDTLNIITCLNIK